MFHSEQRRRRYVGLEERSTRQEVTRSVQHVDIPGQPRAAGAASSAARRIPAETGDGGTPSFTENHPVEVRKGAGAVPAIKSGFCWSTRKL